jgi:hypothetical protein
MEANDMLAFRSCPSAPPFEGEAIRRKAHTQIDEAAEITSEAFEEGLPLQKSDGFAL